MIAIESTNEHPLASLSRFFSAHGDTYRRLLSTGDIGDHCKGRGRATASQADIDSQMDAAIRRIRKGEPAHAVARDMGVNESTMHARLRNRGLTVRKIRNQ